MACILLSGCALFNLMGLQYRLGRLHGEGRYAEAVPVAVELLELTEKEFPPDHSQVVQALNILAGFYYVTGDYDKAKPLIERAIAIEQARDPDGPELAQLLNNLAGLYWATGDYSKVAPTLERSVAIYEKAHEPDHPDLARALNNLAILYSDTGECARAVPLAERSLAIYEAKRGADHPDVAEALQTLGICHMEMGDSQRALLLHERGLAIREKKLGREHPEVAESLINLAELHRRMGEYAKAPPLLERSQAICEKAQGPENPCVAISLNNLADIQRDAGDYAAAAPLYERSLAMHERVLGPEHPAVAESNNQLVRLHWARGDLARAQEYLVSATEIEERNIALFLPSASEGHARAFMAKLSGSTNAALSLQHLRPGQSSTTRLALLTVLRRKGRVLDAVAGSHEALRRQLEPEDRSTFNALLARRDALARLVLRGPGSTPREEHRKALDELRREVDVLERQAQRRGGVLRTVATPVQLEDVQARIPARAALVEMVAYETFEPVPARGESKRGPMRFAALVLRSEGPPRWTALGDARELVGRAEAFRQALRTPRLSPIGLSQEARQLYELVIAPLAALLDGVDTLLLAPDGALNLIPFGALIDGKGHYLVERFAITYLTSGRDLLRFSAPRGSRGPALVVAAPDYDHSLQGVGSEPVEGGAGIAGARSRDLGELRFDPLPGTLREAKAVERILGAKALTGALATEGALKRARRPQVLHVATHGFFLSDQVSPPETRAGGLRPFPPGGAGLLVSGPAKGENPLLRAGLAFAGANRRENGEEDGILTALEMTGLDLWGTKLVVLSACETGLGEVQVGEGVYGLRRALVIAGSESQLASLWKVNDAATQELMAAYYVRLGAGEGRAEALRHTQLEMLRSPVWRHPYYWASFIPIGAWGPIGLTSEGGEGTARTKSADNACLTLPGIRAQDS
jgi:CHAT domain-containing protein/Tfp pilus assembly protein PilF